MYTVNRACIGTTSAVGLSVQVINLSSNSYDRACIGTTSAVGLSVQVINLSSNSYDNLNWKI